MEKFIGASEIARSFGRFLREVEVQGDRLVVERNGQPVAAVVPLQVYEQWKRERQAFFARAREISERANLSPEEAERLALEAVAAAREQNAQ